MNWRTLFYRTARAEPRATATWLGAAVVLGCGLWLAAVGGPMGARSHTASAAEVTEAVDWVDQRLQAEEQAPGGRPDPLRECRIASLRWDRAVRLAQNEYYLHCESAWSDDREQEYGPFRRRRLEQDPSGDVAAARAAARRALERMPPGPARIRPLWIYSMACSAGGRPDEALGALIEISRYKPRQAWAWRLLAQAYELCGDAGRQELAEEQAWRAGAGRPISPFITTAVRHTPYACPAPHIE